MVETWIIPCNTAFFDITAHFTHQDSVVWKNYFTIKKNDIVYIYIGGATRQIKYRCIVISDNVDATVLNSNQYAIPRKKLNNFFSKKDKYMSLLLERTYPHGVLTYEELKKHGIGQVQLQARVDRTALKYIDEVNMRLNVQEKEGE